MDRDHSSSSDFLAAQTGRDPSTDWDDLLVSSAAACTPTVDASCTHSSGQGVDRQIKEICDLLRNVFIKDEKYVKFLEHRGEAAQDLLDIIQKLLDDAPLTDRFRTILYVALVRLCRKSESYPRSFELEGVTDKDSEAYSRGTFGDIYEAYYNGSPICLKAAKVYRQRNDLKTHNEERNRVHKAFFREAVVWGQLSHANIVPFYGIFFVGKTLHLVSPLVHNGNIYDFLFKKPEADRTSLISGIAAGMRYLHDNGVVHGDLKCANVLVAESEQALLTDFGFSYVTDNHDIQKWMLSSDQAIGGTFEAPEQYNGDKKRRNGASDVFAFGMLCYEMFALPLPVAELRDIYLTILLHSRLPGCPRNGPRRGLTESLWKVVETCLSANPEDRPTAAMIQRQLPSTSKCQNFEKARTRPGFEPGDAMITKAFNHLRAL